MVQEDTKGIVVLKPTSSEATNGDIYTVPREIFLPNPETAANLITTLNQMDLNRSTGIEYLESKRPANMQFSKGFDLNLAYAERLAVDMNCNIIGGIFLMYISSYGINLGNVLGRSVVAYGDKEFTLALYSNQQTIDFFNNPQALTDSDRVLIESVLYNNTGQFLTVEVENAIKSQESETLNKIAFLKRVFRHLAEQSIRWTGKTFLRDNMVHSPDTLSDVESQRKALERRFIEQ